MIDKWLNFSYPQNYILRNPFKGTLIVSIFIFGFISLYKPFNTHAAGDFSFELTMALYGFFSAIFIFLAVIGLKTIKYFSNEKDWTILKEFLAVLIILFVLGIAIYALGFFIEGPDKRWNILTFLNSIEIAFLTGIIPLTYFTAINYRNFFSPVISHNEVNAATTPEDLIRISSQLKKDDLSFYPSEFLYAESDGNYVTFYLNKSNLVKKVTIRNSINNVEKQLSAIPYFVRTHRAFIVNLKKVRSKQGNSLGYLVKLTGIEVKIPVSRNNTHNFNRLFPGFHA
jgi:DNA-binding LytR/AlgR family response regulator